MDSLMAVPAAHVSVRRRERLEKQIQQNLTHRPHVHVLSSQAVNPILSQRPGTGTDPIAAAPNPEESTADPADLEPDGTFLPVNVRSPDSSQVVIHAAWTPKLIKAADAAAAVKNLYEEMNVNRGRTNRYWQNHMSWYCRELVLHIENELEAALEKRRSSDSSSNLPLEDAVDADMILAWRHAIARLKGIVGREPNSLIDTAWISPAFTPRWFDAETAFWRHAARAVSEMVAWVEPSWEYAKPVGRNTSQRLDGRPLYGDGLITMCLLLPKLEDSPHLVSQVCLYSGGPIKNE